MDRRTFLATGLATGTAFASTMISSRLFAAPQAQRTKLVLIFLRGAYDAMSIVAPTANDFYHEARPTIALAKPDPANPAAALALDADWALHPALADSIMPLWAKKQIAFVPFAGPDNMSRSHFETQDYIELGQGAGHRDYASGFMARLAAKLGSERAISFTQKLPLCFQGAANIPNYAIGRVGKSGVSATQSAAIEQMYQSGASGRNDLGASVKQGFAVRNTVYEAFAAEMTASARGAPSAQGFALAAQRVGRLMRDQYDLAFIDVGGWDTHVNQGGATGYLANRIGELGHGLTGLIAEIGPDAWRDTTVVVISEFGRTFRENGDRGTDHGHGSVYWVLGGGVAGGRIAGKQVALSPQTLNQERDLPVLTDYRALLGGIFARKFGMPAAALGSVFPGIAPLDLKLV